MNVQQTDNKPSNEKKNPNQNQKPLKGLQTPNLNMMVSYGAYH